jgi:hypothetical protein
MNTRAKTQAWIRCAGAALLVSLAAYPVAAADDPLGDDLRGVVAGNVAAYDKEDLDAAMAFVHTQSPDYESTKAALTDQFADLDVTSELVNFQYVGHDDEFAVARVKLKTTGKPDSGFVGNTTDSMMIFHMEGGKWKLWTEQVLGVEILE